VLSLRSGWLSAVVLLSACAGPQLANYEVQRRAVDLNELPWLKQEGNQGGPAALAMALAASGVQATPDELTPLVRDRGTGEVPQPAITAGAAHYGRVGYVMKSRQLDLDVVHEVQAGHPALLLLHTGVMVKQWQYALVIGVDPVASVFTIRTGSVERQQMSFGDLLAQWRDSAYWAVLVLRPEELPDPVSATSWLAAAMQLEQAGQPAAAAQAYAGLSKRWPDNTPAWVGLGRSSRAAGQLEAATEAYLTALKLQPESASAHHGLAEVLLDRQCADQAQDEAETALNLEQDPALRRIYQRTKVEAEKHSGPSVFCQIE
jgi:tetratricopeptide (TPR) repeat protein